MPSYLNFDALARSLVLFICDIHVVRIPCIFLLCFFGGILGAGLVFGIERAKGDETFWSRKKKA
jgi:hypothetical protein